MTTITSRGQYRVAPEIAQRILAELAAGASVEQLCRNPNWRVDDVGAVLRSQNLSVDERTGTIVRAAVAGLDDPILVLLTFAKSRAVRDSARRVLAARSKLLAELDQRQGAIQTELDRKLALDANNAFIDVLNRERDAAVARTRALSTRTRKGA